MSSGSGCAEFSMVVDYTGTRSRCRPQMRSSSSSDPRADRPPSDAIGEAVIYSGRSRQSTFIAGSFAALRQRCRLKLLRYLSSTNLPVFVNRTYLNIKCGPDFSCSRSYVNRSCCRRAGAAFRSVQLHGIRRKSRHHTVGR
jgi:hypothetical protein